MKIRQMIRGIRDARAWQKKHERLAPREGGLAPDFELSDVNGETAVRLSDFRSRKSVALVFGSFT